MKKFHEKTDGLLSFSELKQTRFKLVYWIIFGLLILMSLACLLPPLWIFLSGFKDTAELLMVPPTLLPKEIHFSKLGEVWKLLNFKQFYTNSFLLILGNWIFCILLNGIAGYVLSRLKPKGTMLICTLIFWSMLLPTSMNMVPLFISFVDVPLLHVNITDTYLPMWLMAGANAFNVLLFRNFFNSIPMSYIEAARIDGCSDLGIFAKIMLPLSKPIIMVVSIFTVNEAWGSFLWPYLVVKDAASVPIAVKIFLLKSAGITTDKYMIVLLFTIIPPAIIFCFFSKHIMGGMNMSGLKG